MTERDSREILGSFFVAFGVKLVQRRIFKENNVMKNKRLLALIISLVLIFSNTISVCASEADTKAGEKVTTEATADDSEEVLTIGADEEPKDDKMISMVLVVGGFLIGIAWSKNATKKKMK